MAENGVHEIADQLETPTAQSPAAIQVPVSQDGATGSTGSDLTDIDESLMQDDAPVSQSVPTASHFIDPAAPRVSYQVSASGELMIMEEPRTPHSKGYPFLELPAKSASSPITTKVRAPSLAVERIMGPKQPIPARILELLEEWHEEFPHTDHPSALTGRAPSTWNNFKAFSDDGDECELSIFQISVKVPARRAVTYRIMILHSQNGPEELIVYGQPRPKFKAPLTKGTKGLYLLDWLETEKKGEVQACGLKLWRTDDKKITFSPRMFDDGRKCTRLPGVNDYFNMRRPTTTPKKQSNANDDNEDIASNSSGSSLSAFLRSKRQACAAGYYEAENDGGNKPPMTPLLWGRTTTPMPNESRAHVRVLGSPFNSQKRRRSTLSSDDDVSVPIRYKLMLDMSPQVRIFKTHDANVLFQRAQEFYKDIDNRTGLLCTSSRIEGVRYVGEGCVDELDILQEDVRKFYRPGDKDPVVEVKPAVGF
ncbi:hypothetical protein N7516_009795 [Penicillium verrucosum]|uniref:uncharacterized protein n=1 Tax=Penicillium verrucosum TaxID=60171 RepID=UPI0025454756|nr:uncharacterized protein N7516_009795 [Penicillium verrucosum]KAJ5922092.1 hypothetical protein N7516_009795 [Penicillium verrucosum]